MPRRNLVTLLYVLLAVCAWPQSETDIETSLEQWLSDGASAVDVEQMADVLQELRDKPFNVNDTSDMRLVEMGLVTPFQQQALKVYVRRYGRLTTLAELYFVPGFDSVCVARLLPLMAAGGAPQPARPSIAKALSHPRMRLLTGVSLTSPSAEADPFRLYTRMRVDFGDMLQLQLSHDRDPGEGWFDGTNFYSGHLMVNNIGVLQRAIVGRYNLQFGQGLALWTGFVPFVMLGVSPFRLARGIKTASAFAESNYLHGAAATFNIYKGLTATTFYSNVEGNQLSGANIGYHGQGTRIGLTAAYTSLAETPVPRATPYNYYALRESNTMNISLDAARMWRSLLLYAEAAIDGHLHPAATAGTQFSLGRNTLLGASARYYANGYHAPYGSGPGGGGAYGESALRLDFQTTLNTGTAIAFMTDMVHYPYLRYAAYSPTYAVDLRLQLSHPVTPNLTAVARYRYRAKERNGVVEPQPNYQTELILRRQLQADLIYSDGDWRVLTRLQGVWFACDMHEQLTGFMLFGDIKYCPADSRVSFSARATIFDTEGYDAAIYMTESDLAYNLSTPMLNGQGVRMSVVGGYNFGHGWNISAKYAATVRLETGVSHILKLQLRLLI